MLRVLLTFLLVSAIKSEDEDFSDLYNLLDDKELMSQIQKRLGSSGDEMSKSLAQDIETVRAASCYATKGLIGDGCNFNSKNNTIIETQTSLQNGAVFILDFSNVTCARECTRQCCKDPTCDTAVYQAKGDRHCYLFSCGTPNRCKFATHDHYWVSNVTKTESDSSGPGPGASGPTHKKHESELQNLGSHDGSHDNDLGSHDNDQDIINKPVVQTTRAPTERPTTAAPLKTPKPALGAYCKSYGTECEDPHAECLMGACQCHVGYHAKHRVCRKHCRNEEFECENVGIGANSRQCVHRTYRCDGSPDCEDASDEDGCPVKNKPAYQDSINGNMYGSHLYNVPYGNQPDSQYQFGVPLGGLANQQPGLLPPTNQLYPNQIPANSNVGGQYYIPGLTNQNQGVNIPQTGSQLSGGQWPFVDKSGGLGSPLYQNNYQYQTGHQPSYVPQQTGFNVPVAQNNPVVPVQPVQPINTILQPVQPVPNTNMATGVNPMLPNRNNNQLPNRNNNQLPNRNDNQLPNRNNNQAIPQQIQTVYGSDVNVPLSHSSIGIQPADNKNGLKQDIANSVNNANKAMYETVTMGEETNDNNRYPGNPEQPVGRLNGMGSNRYSDESVGRLNGMGTKNKDDFYGRDGTKSNPHPDVTNPMSNSKENSDDGSDNTYNQLHNQNDNSHVLNNGISSDNHDRAKLRTFPPTTKTKSQIGSPTQSTVAGHNPAHKSNSEGYPDYASWIRYDNDSPRTSISGKKGFARPSQDSKSDIVSKPKIDKPKADVSDSSGNAVKTNTFKSPNDKESSSSGQQLDRDGSGRYDYDSGRSPDRYPNHLDDYRYPNGGGNRRPSASFDRYGGDRYGDTRHRPSHGSRYPFYESGYGRARDRSQYPVWDQFKDEYYYPDEFDNGHTGHLSTNHDVDTGHLATNHDVDNGRLSTNHDVDNGRPSTNHDLDTGRLSTNHDLDTGRISTNHDLDYGSQDGHHPDVSNTDDTKVSQPQHHSDAPVVDDDGSSKDHSDTVDDDLPKDETKVTPPDALVPHPDDSDQESDDKSKPPADTDSSASDNTKPVQTDTSSTENTDDQSIESKTDQSANKNDNEEKKNQSTHLKSVTPKLQNGTSSKDSKVTKTIEFRNDDEVSVESFTDGSQGPIVALALGLGITMVLLIFVGCRLRTVKRRLRKGRALHSNEADYLINGMYL